MAKEVLASGLSPAEAVLCTVMCCGVAVTVRGPVDTSSVCLLRYRLEDLLRQSPPRIVLNLAGVTRCLRPGVDLLHGVRLRAAERGGWVRLAKPPPQLLPVLTAAGLNTYASIEAALHDATLPDRARHSNVHRLAISGRKPSANAYPPATATAGAVK